MGNGNPARNYLDPPHAADRQFVGAQMELAPWVFPSWESRAFNPAASVPMPANGIGNRTQIVAYAMPAGFAGVVKKLALVALQGGFSDFSGDVIFRLFKNTVPVEDYQNIPYQIGSLAQPADTWIPLQPNQTLYAYVETYNNPPTGLAAALFYGVRWPFTKKRQNT